MNFLSRPSLLAWLGTILFAAIWLVTIDAAHIRHLRAVGEQAPAAAPDPASPTGYAREARNLIVPPDAARSQQWIMVLQKMLHTDSWSAPRSDFDNAPEGRDLGTRAPYRWWLGAVARVERTFGSGPQGQLAERAALHADPLLHFALCLGGALLIAWRFGPAAGAFVAIATAILLAQAGLFAPGVPDDHHLFLFATAAALILFLVGCTSARSRGWLAASGAASALAIWVDPAGGAAALAAFALAAAVTVGLLSSSKESVRTFPWRGWAAGGSLVLLASAWIEGKSAAAPAGLFVPNLLLALAWFGGAEILTQLVVVRQRLARRANWLALAAGGAGLLIAAVGWAQQRGGAPARLDDTVSDQIVTLAQWLREEGLGFRTIAALLPLLFVVPAAWAFKRTPSSRFVIGLALANVVAWALLAGFQFRWWDLLTVALLGLLAVSFPATLGTGPTLGLSAALALLMVPALAAAWPKPGSNESLAPAEAQALVERDLAQWLAARAEPGAIALAPPALSGSLCYYGGLRVVTSPYPGNDKGLEIATRIVSVGSPDEAQSLVQRRGLRYLILPAKDGTLDLLAQKNAAEPQRTLVGLLRQWLPPVYLRPVPYLQPVIPGLEGMSYAVFEVVEPQENVLAVSRLADYFVETGQLQLAGAVAGSLGKAFADNAGALISRAHVALARNEGRVLAQVMPELLAAIADGKDEDLPWERRANLAVVLAQTKQTDGARKQAEFCFQEATAERLRALGPVSLFRLLALGRSHRLQFAEPGLDQVARNLLPPEFQAQLPP